VHGSIGQLNEAGQPLAFYLVNTSDEARGAILQTSGELRETTVSREPIQHQGRTYEVTLAPFALKVFTLTGAAPPGMAAPPKPKSASFLKKLSGLPAASRSGPRFTVSPARSGAWMN